MDKTSAILTAIMTLALVILIAPNVIAMNRGKALRNIALWLAIFAGLGIIYKTFGPGSNQPLFNGPGMMQSEQDTTLPMPGDDGSQGFTPPKE
ncbi:MAG: hypothetical protein WAO98_07015 [Alphaproteobacteria bacterium]